MFPDEVDMFVNFICNDEDPGITCKDLCNSFKFVFGIDRTGGVAWGTEYDQFGFRRDGRFDLLRPYLEFVFNAGNDKNRFAFCNLDDLPVGYPVG